MRSWPERGRTFWQIDMQEYRQGGGNRKGGGAGI